MASLALLDSKPYYAYTMLGYGKDTGPIAFNFPHQARHRAYRCGHSFHPTQRNESSKQLKPLADDIFQTVVISFILLSDPALKALYDKFGVLELAPFLESLGVDCQVSLMAFSRAIWFCCFENDQNLQQRESKSLLDINNFAQCAVSKLASTKNYSLKQYSEQDLTNDRLVMELCGYLNADSSVSTSIAVGEHAYPADFVMVPSLFGITALYNARLHSDPFSTLKFEQGDFVITINPFKRTLPINDDGDDDENDDGFDINDDGDNDENVDDIWMNDEPLAKRIKY